VAFCPPGAPVPSELRTDRLFLRPLRATDVELDYDAVMSSAEMLRRWSQSDWPSDEFTLAENLEDLQRHEREHEERVAFTFTVLDPAGTRCLGCVYLVPLRPEEVSSCEGALYPVRVAFWVRFSELAEDLDRHLLESLRTWLRIEWAFDRIAYTISREDGRLVRLFSEAGLGLLAPIVLADGRAFAVYGEPPGAD
jgi:hypothetical protein